MRNARWAKFSANLIDPNPQAAAEDGALIYWRQGGNEKFTRNPETKVALTIGSKLFIHT
jgi:hypothetical protein